MPRNQMRNEIQIFILALLFRQVILFLIAYFFIWKTWGLRYIIINKRLTALWFYDFKDFAQVMLPKYASQSTDMIGHLRVLRK